MASLLGSEVKKEIKLTKFSQTSGEYVTYEVENTDTWLSPDYKIHLYPNGNSKSNSDYISITVSAVPKFTHSLDCRLVTECTVSVLDADAQHRFIQSFTQEDTYHTEEFGFDRYLKRETLVNDNDGLLPNDTLTLICEFIYSYRVSEKLLSESPLEVPELYELLYYSKFIMTNDNTQDIIHLKGYNGQIPHPARKSVLKRYSPVLNRMFTNEMIEANAQELFIPDIDHDTLLRILIHADGGAVTFLFMDELYDLYMTADKYDIVSLKETCVKHMKNVIREDNAGGILHLADLHSDQKLKEFALSYIRSHFDEVSSTEEWHEIVEIRPDLELEVTNVPTDQPPEEEDEELEINPSQQTNITEQEDTFDFYH